MPRFLLHLVLAGFAPIFAIAGTLNNTTSICQQLNSRLPGRISYPGNPAYSHSLSSYYSAQERALEPSCIFTPTQTSEVSQFVKLIDAHDNAPFAIRGGGHTLWTGAANIQGGVTVDMRSMKSLALSDDHKVVSVGGGARYSDLYPQLDPHNLTIMGGRVPGIGVGGFSTGGGITFHARRNGWDCDNIYGYEVVIASGEVVYATANSNRDLWLALKGGSNNFGIITRFDFATFPQGDMWGGVLQFNYTKDVVDAQTKAFSTFMDPKNFDDAAEMGIVLNFENPGGIKSVENTLFYLDPVENPPVYDSFTSIPDPTLEELSVSNVSSLVTSFGKSLPSNVNRSTELVYSFKNGDAALYSKLFQMWEDGTKTLANIEGLQLQYLIQPQPVTNGTNSLGLVPGEKDVVMGLLTAAYTNSADDDVVMENVKAIVKKQEDTLQEEGLLLDFKYLNYADKSQDPIGSYGKENKKRLQEASKKYDPNGLFQTRVPGGFKLFD